MPLEPLDLTVVEKRLPGCKVPRPIGRTLSGHAAGQQFEDLAYDLIKKQYPDITWRQFEFLNELYGKNLTKTTYDDRCALLPFKSLQFLLNRGRTAVCGWSSEKQFAEKQDDTADILVVRNGHYHLIDAKTTNKVKDGQPPNIISSLKVATLCATMIEEKAFDKLEIVYLGITWLEDKDELSCESAYVRRLFRATPSKLYINWAAALQIQFHVSDLDQGYGGTVEDWAYEYLKVFVTKAKGRIEYMEKNWVERFAKYVKATS